MKRNSDAGQTPSCPCAHPHALEPEHRKVPTTSILAAPTHNSWTGSTAAALAGSSRHPTPNRHVSSTKAVHPTTRAIPFPKVTEPICRLPLPTLLYRLEAANLGDLLRIWVRPSGKLRYDTCPSDFQGPSAAHRTSANAAPLCRPSPRFSAQCDSTRLAAPPPRVATAAHCWCWPLRRKENSSRGCGRRLGVPSRRRK